MNNPVPTQNCLGDYGENMENHQIHNVYMESLKGDIGKWSCQSLKLFLYSRF